MVCLGLGWLWRPGADSHTDGDLKASAFSGCHLNSIPRGYAGAYPHAEGYTDKFRQANGGPDVHAHSRTHPYGHAHAHPYANPHGHACGHRSVFPRHPVP
ncbi:MAG: hypothetical protein HY535_08415 [Chloroflexi bacterium]|nr:hypothetical protein [Chloroflexota bacterium]